MKKDYVVLSVNDEDFRDVSAEITKVVEKYGLTDKVMELWVEYLQDRIDGMDADLFSNTLCDAARSVMEREGHYAEYKAAVEEQYGVQCE